MNWQTTPADRAEGSLKSNPFSAFEAYANPSYQTPEVSEGVEEGEEAATAPRGGAVKGDTGTYETVK